MTTAIRVYAKALVAILAPLVTTLVLSLLDSLSANAETTITAVATAIMVWLVPNTPKSVVE